MKKVQILMSTFNGEKYLREQLDSILSQDYSDISLLIRDDGSTDDTVRIIHEVANTDHRVSYYQGQNLGVKNSFFDLMLHADNSMDYYALSDQDDVWSKDKISAAVNKIGKEEGYPALYCSKPELVDQKLTPLVTTIKRINVVPSFGNALVENINTGCTCLFNKELLELVKGHIPEFTVMHDWWLYLSASALGRVIYDEESHIYYRQHGNNIIGSRSNYYDEFKGRIKNYRKYRGQLRKQVMEFYKLYQTDQEKEQMMITLIKAKSNFFFRWKIFFGDRIYRQRRIDNLIFKLLFLFGQI